jgi:hypothetical protein
MERARERDIHTMIECEAVHRINRALGTEQRRKEENRERAIENENGKKIYVFKKLLYVKHK